MRRVFFINFLVGRQDFGSGLRLNGIMRMETPDNDLATAAAAGDRAAFSALISRHYDRIHGLCWRLTGAKAEAEDLTQDVCMALPRKLAGWRGEAKFTTWLYRVVVNAAHDRRRRQAVHARAASGWGDYELARQDEIEAGREAERWLYEAMRGLPGDLRDTVALLFGEDLSQAEAAEVLGIGEGTVSWRMSEVKKRLRAFAAREAKA